MRRIVLALNLVLCLMLAAGAALAAPAAKAKAAKPAAEAQAKDAAGFDVMAFRKSFTQGLAPRPGMPALGPENVVVDDAEKAARFAGVDIYLVRGKLSAEGFDQPFTLFVSADGRYYISDIIDMSAGKSILKDARDTARAGDLEKLGHTVLQGAGANAVTFVSDPFCPYCRQAFNYLMERQAKMSQFRLAHFPLSSHPGADIACALMVWAEDKAPDKAMDFVRFAYTQLAVPKIKDRSEPELRAAWTQVAGAFLAHFPELKALGADPEAIVDALRDSPYVKRVQQDMAVAAAMDISGTPIIFVGAKRVEGFDPERLAALLK